MVELVQLSFDKIMQTKSYTVIVLGSSEKKFAIYTDPSVGKTLQLFLTEVNTLRPSTHTLIDLIFEGADIRIKQVIINDVQDTIYYAQLFLEQDRGDIRHIIQADVRPSDGLTLALMQNAPVYCTKEVLDKVIPVQE